VNQTVLDTIGDGGIADLLVPARDRQLGSKDGGTGLVKNFRFRSAATIQRSTTCTPLSAFAFLDDVLSAQRIVINDLLCSYGHVRAQGIRDVYSSLPSGTLRKLLGRSRRIRILKTWFPSDVGLVKGLWKALLSGASVELFLCDPDSPLIRYRCAAAGCDLNEGLARDLEAVKMALSAISRGISGRISIYIYDAWPGSPIIDFDEGVFESSFLRGSTSLHSRWFWNDRNSEHGKALLSQFDFNDDEITARLTSEQAMRRWYDKHSSHRPSNVKAGATQIPR
jgi:hypothetical protein